MARKAPKLEDFLPYLTALFELLSQEQRDLIIKHASIHVYKKNEIIYAEDDVPAYMMCLVSGKVKIFKEGVGGRTQIMRVVRPVGYFGFRAAFAGQRYINTATAIESSVVLRVPIGTVIRLMQENARFGWFFTERLALELGKADERVISLTQKHIRGRLAESLLFLYDCYGVEEDGCTLSIYLSREDLASLSNMTTSNAIRTLSAFASEKMVAVDGRKIKIIERGKLEKISRIG